MRRIVAFLAAAGMAVSPVAASAQDASALSLARAASPMSPAVSFFQDDNDSAGGGSTAVILGLALVVLIGMAAISGNNRTLNNPPASP